jgi:predicted DCC family thiol-disulfide oxidoreductase YuxK
VGGSRAGRALDVSEPVVVLYDADCGFCRVALALLLRWDTRRRLEPAAIQSARGELLLGEIEPAMRMRSWHAVDPAGAISSGGAGVPLVFGALPSAMPIAWLAARFPSTTARVYDWIAAHRALLGRALNARTRAWGARVIAQREHPSRGLRST